MPWLVCVAGEDKGTNTLLEDGESVMMGRDPECGIQLLQSSASRRHCQAVCKGNRLYVEDLNSSNGIKFKGKKVHGKTIKLKLGQTFGVGSDLFEFSKSCDQYAEITREVATDLDHQRDSDVFSHYTKVAAEAVERKKDKKKKFSLFWGIFRKDKD